MRTTYRAAAVLRRNLTRVARRVGGALRPGPFGGAPRPAREIAARALRHTDEQLSGTTDDTTTPAAHTPRGAAWLTYLLRQH